MAKQSKTQLKLIERCEILQKVVVSISEIYCHKDTTNDQKKLIETILGAAIWYLPHGEKYWTGKISKAADEHLRKNHKAKLTKEHQFPRKIAAKELLNDINKLKNEESSLLKLYEEKYAKFNYVTKQENKKISKHQRDDVFTDIETAYKEAKIELIDTETSALRQYKKKLKDKK